MLIDSHCHLDASEFDSDRGEVLARSRVNGIVIPAVASANFSTVIALAHRLDEASGQGARGPELCARGSR
jgi:TatD DNase family protein